MTIEEAIHEFDDAIVETAHNGRKVGDYDHVVISSDVAAVLQRWIHDVRKWPFTNSEPDLLSISPLNHSISDSFLKHPHVTQDTTATNLSISERIPMHPAVSHVLKYFAFDHLPPHLKETSRKFYDLAHEIAASKPDSQETTVALRKLLESKDAAVRAQLD